MTENNDGNFFETQPMFICDQVSLTILEANQAATSILGYSGNELLEKRILDIAERKAAGELKRVITNAGFSKQDKIWIFKTRDQKSLYFQLSAHLINYKGIPAKMVIAHTVPEFEDAKNPQLLSSELNIQNFPMAEIEWNAHMKILGWSGKAEELFGYSEEEAINSPDLLVELIYKDDLEYVQKELEAAFAKRSRSLSIINRNVTKSGEVIYCEWYNSIMYNADGEPVSMYSLTHNVTAREEAMDNARRSMKSYQDLFHSISDTIYLLNADDVILEANNAMEHMYEYTREEVIGKKSYFLTAPGKFDEGRYKVIKEKAALGSASKYEGWRRRKNGEVFLAEILVSTGNYFGEQVLIVIERNISERKEYEEALKYREGLFSNLFNSSPIGIALLNAHKEVVMVNEGFEKLFGYSEVELKGLEIDRLIVPKQKHQDATKLSESDKVIEVTEQRLHKDGKVIDVIIYAVPVLVEGKVVGIYGIYVDITDRKKAEEQVRKSLREKEILLAEIHHRVKNNLAVITGLLELQSYSAENESARRILKDSQMRVNSIALVHEKLYQSEDFSEVSVNQYFRELASVVHKTMTTDEFNIDLELDIESIKLPITQAIPCGLLLNEILTNSFKHAFNGRKEGNIRIIFREKDNILNLNIRDNGMGLPLEHSENNVNSSLGMTLIKTLAKQLDATFDFKSENGAIFDFKFQKQERES